MYPVNVKSEYTYEHKYAEKKCVFLYIFMLLYLPIFLNNAATEIIIIIIIVVFIALRE